MSMQYIRDRYKVPAYRGGRVRVNFRGDIKLATIKTADHRVRVHIDGHHRTRRWIYHPLDVDYLVQEREE